MASADQNEKRAPPNGNQLSVPPKHESHRDRASSKVNEKLYHYDSNHAPSGHSKRGDKKHYKSEGPAGGYDDTPLPHAPPGYTVRIVFHRATNLPMADINSFSSDPFVLAQINTGLPMRHKEDPPLRMRTQTIRKCTDPEWNAEWIVANIPASGFKLKARIYDEDPADHDDRLGNTHVLTGPISESWEGIHEKSYKIRKRMGSKRAYLIRALATCIRAASHMHGDLFISIEVLGRTPGNDGGRAYTLGPQWWTKHYSPLLGRMTGMKEDRKDEKKDDVDTSAQEKKQQQSKTQRYNFQANQFQLHGPIPESLYHRYVEFKPFVKSMFTSKGIRGFLLSKALHHQHNRVYNFDRSTKYGHFDGPSKEMTLQFLDLVHWDKGGRVYTYVLTLDSLFRFTETGKEFGIDMLSKHTMHSDVSVYIAFSGEFFIRRLKHKWRGPKHIKDGSKSNCSLAPSAHSPTRSRSTSHNRSDESTSLFPGGEAEGSNAKEESHLGRHSPAHPPDDIDGGPPKNNPPNDPGYYELIIDNDSGTYRPNAKLLPLLKEFIMQNFPGLKVVTLDCQGDEELMTKLKKEQRERKEKEGDHIIYAQGNGSDTSISSSDEEALDALERGDERQSKSVKKLEEQGKLKLQARKDRVKAFTAPGKAQDGDGDDPDPRDKDVDGRP